MTVNDQPQAPLGTPQFQVVLADKLGGQKTEQIKIDSNRLSPVAEERAHWLDSLAIPARTSDICVQSLCWISGAGFACSILRSLPPIVELLVPLLAMLLVAIAISCYAWSRFKDLRPFLLYRGFLVAIGIVMGGVL